MAIRLQHYLAVGMTALAVAGCGKSDPGPVAGTWRLTGAVPMTIQYRAGESEAMGLIEKVSYEVNGSDVIVKSESGPMKGTAFRLRVTGPDTLQSELGTLRRVR